MLVSNIADFGIYFQSDPSGWAESSLLRVILDKRDACLGPWIPGRYDGISYIYL
jgi:hypothetical protein